MLSAIDALEIDEDSFQLNFHEGVWSATRPALWDGRNIPFTIAELRTTRRGRNQVSISVSVRSAEVLDPIAMPHRFDASGILTGVSVFGVDELAAEKIVAWCLKDDMARHYVDLAVLARDHAAAINCERVLELVRQKFELERRALESQGRYRSLGLRTPSDLRALHTREAARHDR
jgi:hypothetical protein